MKFVSILFTSLFAVSGAAQAQMSHGTMEMPMKEAKPSQDAAGALTDAVVQRIDVAKSEVILKHGDIPNLAMPAMTMAFSADQKTLGKLKVGDKVRFHAELMEGKPTLTRIEAAR